MLVYQLPDIMINVEMATHINSLYDILAMVSFILKSKHQFRFIFRWFIMNIHVRFAYNLKIRNLLNSKTFKMLAKVRVIENPPCTICSFFVTSNIKDLK